MRINEFLAPFFPDDREVIHGRVIRPKKSKVWPPALCIPFTRQALREDVSLQNEFRKWNRTHGIYFAVNAGGEKDDDITRVNAVFCEMDDVPLQEQLDFYEMAPLSPSIQVVTKKSVHAYWLLDEFILPNEFVTIQKGLIKYFNADAKICNPSRVMRLPFFQHVAQTDQGFEYKRVTVHAFNEYRYSFTELFNAFPYVAPKPKVFPKALKSAFRDVTEELGQRLQQTPMFHTKGQYGYTRGTCHDGHGDSGIWIHMPTGAVGCFAECPWWTIANSFGIYKEN